VTARSWREGDPEPADHPTVVALDGNHWQWQDGDDLHRGYHALAVTTDGGWVTMGIWGVRWPEIFRFTPVGAALAEGGPVSARITRLRYYTTGWVVLAAVLLIAAMVRAVTGKWPR
jgi:hypothetical protein